MDQTKAYVSCRAITNGPKHHFFGYYDKSPWDITGRYLLSTEVDFNDRLPRPEDVAVIGLVDSQNKDRFTPIAETRAWNWQQGAMAQWVSSETSQSVIYNDQQGGQLVSVLLNVETGERRVLPLPIYTLTPNGRFALCIDYLRLSKARSSYGYASLVDVIPTPDTKSGIYKLNLFTGQFELLLSYAEVIAFQPHPLMEQAQHWIDHLLVNSDSSRFLFYHRFILPDSSMYSRLLTADLEGKYLQCLISGSASHNCWRNNYQVLVWARQRSLTSQTYARKILNLALFRPVLGWLHHQEHNWVRQKVIGDSFLLLDDRQQKIEVKGAGILTEDGHPSFSPDGRWLLIDTYPDTDHHRHLMLYDWQNNKRVPLGSFYSPPTISGGIRCDLHPRWSRNGQQICIDSTHDGTRQMYVLDVSTIC